MEQPGSVGILVAIIISLSCVRHRVTWDVGEAGFQHELLHLVHDIVAGLWLSGKEPDRLSHSKPALGAAVDHREVHVVRLQDIVVGLPVQFGLSSAEIDGELAGRVALFVSVESGSAVGLRPVADELVDASVGDLDVAIGLLSVGGSDALGANFEWDPAVSPDLVPPASVVRGLEVLHCRDGGWASASESVFALDNREQQ